MNFKKVLFILILILFFSCKHEEKESTLFELKTNTGITFSNILTETERLNPYTYKNFYNGGGVVFRRYK